MYYGATDTVIVCGTRSRYSCRDLVEVDRHLLKLVGRLRRTLPSLTVDRQAWIRQQYGVDLDSLLDARIMLRALATLDADLARLEQVA